FTVHRIGRVLKLAHWRGGIKVENPSKTPGEARQLRAFIPPQTEDEPLEPLGEHSSGSAFPPHKTLLEPLEPLEPPNFDTKSESRENRESDAVGTDLSQRTVQHRVLEVQGNPVVPSGSMAQALKSMGCDEPLVDVPVAQPSVPVAQPSG